MLVRALARIYKHCYYFYSNAEATSPAIRNNFQYGLSPVLITRERSRKWTSNFVVWRAVATKHQSKSMGDAGRLMGDPIEPGKLMFDSTYQTARLLLKQWEKLFNQVAPLPP